MIEKIRAGIRWLGARWLPGEEGQDLAEYGLLGVLIAVVAMAAVTAIGTQLTAFWERIATGFPIP